MDNGFIMFANYAHYFEKLTGDQTKELMLALFAFAENGEYIESNDVIVDLVYKTMTDNINFGSKRRLVSIENGKRGGRPKKKKTEPQEEKPTAKQKEFAKSLDIDISKCNKTEAGQKIQEAKKQQQKAGVYQEPNWDELTKDEPTSEPITDLNELLGGGS